MIDVTVALKDGRTERSAESPDSEQAAASVRAELRQELLRVNPPTGGTIQ